MGGPSFENCNTWSELTTCNAHLRDLSEKLKHEVWEAGGFPLGFPVMSTGETNGPHAASVADHGGKLH
jgi:L-arabonate dehydrase